MSGKIWRLWCYGEIAAETFTQEKDAINAAHEHIQHCPRGPMPWATVIHWHEVPCADFLSLLTAVANGEYLDHRITLEETER